ncbi:MAG: Flp family type IVb pilin [Pirellulaceae bacterium]
MCRTERHQTPPSTVDPPQATCCQRVRARRIGCRTRRGATAIEYCLLLSLISVVVIGAVYQIGVGAKLALEEVSSTLEEINGGGGGGAGDAEDEGTQGGDAGGGGGDGEGEAGGAEGGTGEGKTKGKGKGKGGGK